MVIKLSSPETKGFWEIPILYEDADVLVFDKPAGLPIASDSPELRSGTLVEMLRVGIAESKPWAASRSLSFLRCASRLDAEDSGVLPLAKNKPALISLLNLFGSEQPALSLLTLVHGAPVEDRFSSEAKIAAHPTLPGVMRVDAKSGKRARTNFEVVERFRGWTLLRCMPLTHRPHQVRVHLARLGLRVAGDEIYGGKPLLLSSLKPRYHLKPNHSERPLIGSACLHAEKLEIQHPVTGQPLSVAAPLPKKIGVALRYLREFAAAA